MHWRLGAAVSWQCRVHAISLDTDSRRRRGVQLDIERKLRGLLTKDKQKAEEEAALAIGLCRSVP